MEDLKKDVRNFVPAAVLRYIDIQQEKWASEIRRVSVLFMNIKIDLKLAKTPQGLERIQQVIQTV